jgi:hypothetical protein
MQSPLWGIEAIFLVLFLSEIRSDFRIIANYFLERIDEVKDTLLFVNPFGGMGRSSLICGRFGRRYLIFGKGGFWGFSRREKWPALALGRAASKSRRGIPL